MGVTTLDAAAVRAWSERSVELLEAARAELDATNVFPVPDHDTGTNLAVTARAAAEALRRADDVPGVAGALAHLAAGAVRGARGNSGVLLSQLLRGLADADAGADADDAPPDEWGAPHLASALRRAATAARAAVADPVDGTILDVADAAARAATRVADAADATAHRSDSADATAQRADPADPVDDVPGTDLLALLDPVVHDARAALAATPGRLGPLAAGGVVDAGAAGLVLVLEALRRTVGGPPLDVVGGALARTAPDTPAPSPSPDGAERGAPAFEVQYLLQPPSGADAATTLDAVTRALRPLGDSLVVADGGDGVWAVHVHVDDPGAAVEVGAGAAAWGGRLSGVRITALPPAPDALVTSDPRSVTDPQSVPAPADHRPVVVVAEPDVLAPARAALDDAGVDVLAPDATPPGGDLVVVAVGEVATATARAATAATVVPVRSLVQALAAVAVHDPTRRAVDDTVAMAEAAGACRHGHLSVAEGDGLTIVGRCRPGDVLGHVGGEIAVIGATADEVAARVLERLLAGGGELVTVLHTPDAADLAGALADRVRAAGEHLDVEVRDVGPMASPVLLGVE